MRRSASAGELLHDSVWFQTLAERMSGGVVLVAGDGTLEAINPVASQLLQASTIEAQQLVVHDLLQALEDKSRVKFRSAPGAPELDVERVTHPQGSRRGSMLLLRDHDERQVTDTDLLLANRMRSLENLYRAMAHDLKSPLQAILLNVDLLRDATREAGSPRQSEIDTYLEVIQGEISRLGRSIQILLSQAGPSTNTKRRVDLRRIQREVVALLQPVARRKRMRIESSTPNTSVSALGNRDRIKQAVLNLVVNAIEATPKSGTLELELASNGELAYFEVRDDGPGIPIEMESKVFLTHYTTKKTGSGIGLGVARSVARAHGGELVLERRKPRGTIARLSLPLVHPARS